jgi:hypothetical protein
MYRAAETDGVFLKKNWPFYASFLAFHVPQFSSSMPLNVARLVA